MECERVYVTEYVKEMVCETVYGMVLVKAYETETECGTEYETVLVKAYETETEYVMVCETE